MFVARQSLLRAVGTAPAFRVSSAPLVARRYIQTQKMTEMEELKLLNAQRLNRPNSPHLTIYRPQITWYLSGLNRLTGVALGGIFYAGALVYCLHPMYPSIDSAHLLSAWADLPAYAKSTIKLALALPATFHTFNGVRHLLWDVGKGLTIKGVYTGGYIVLAATALSSIYLAFFV